MLNFKNTGRMKIAKLRDDQFECVRHTHRKYTPTMMVCVFLFSLSAVVTQGSASKNLAIIKQHLSKY